MICHIQKSVVSVMLPNTVYFHCFCWFVAYLKIGHVTSEKVYNLYYTFFYDSLLCIGLVNVYIFFIKQICHRLV